MGRVSALPSLTLHLPFPGSVVGPALTFRIRQNPQNLSLADVASHAGESGRCPPGPALLFPPKLQGAPSQYPWLNWGAGVGWAAARISLASVSVGSLGWRGNTLVTVSSPSTEQAKAELEAELGLKIVQTGVGEVGGGTPVPRGRGSQVTGQWGCFC